MPRLKHLTRSRLTALHSLAGLQACSSLSSLAPRNDVLGFTLAEVLVTLGIIGVVAALTLPNLIADYRNDVYVRQLQKTANTLENGFKKAMADDGVDKLSDTQLIQSIGPSGQYYTYDSDPIVEANLKKYFNILRFDNNYVEKNSSLYGTSTPFATRSGAMVLADGSIVSFVPLLKEAYENSSISCSSIKRRGGKICSYISRNVTIDVNGYQKPNKYGRDVFKFNLSNEGELTPQMGKEYGVFWSSAPLESSTVYWRNDPTYCGKPNEPLTGDRVSGTGCAARIIENGWKMDY